MCRTLRTLAARSLGETRQVFSSRGGSRTWGSVSARTGSRRKRRAEDSRRGACALRRVLLARPVADGGALRDQGAVPPERPSRLRGARAAGLRGGQEAVRPSAGGTGPGARREVPARWVPLDQIGRAHV